MPTVHDPRAPRQAPGRPCGRRDVLRPATSAAYAAGRTPPAQRPAGATPPRAPQTQRGAPYSGWRGDAGERRGHGAEALVGVAPGGGVRGDLVPAAADEVPPHDDLLLERRAADEQQARAAGGVQLDLVAAHAQVRALPCPHRPAVLEQQHAVEHDDEVLVRRHERQHRPVRAEVDGRAHEVAVPASAGHRTAERADQHRHVGAVDRDLRQRCVVLERRLALRVADGWATHSCTPCIVPA
jgi:hypothetical protein